MPLHEPIGYQIEGEIDNGSGSFPPSIREKHCGSFSYIFIIASCFGLDYGFLYMRG